MLGYNLLNEVCKENLVKCYWKLYFDELVVESNCGVKRLVFELF